MYDTLETKCVIFEMSLIPKPSEQFREQEWSLYSPPQKKVLQDGVGVGSVHHSNRILW